MQAKAKRKLYLTVENSTEHMRILYPLSLLSLFTNLLFAQISVSGTIHDAQTKQPIPYVNIGVKNTAMGTVSDDKGNFQLAISALEATITCSAIGYETLDITGSELRKQRQINLIPKDYDLKAVEIVASTLEGKERRYGVKNKNRGLSIGFGSRNLGTEIGALIPINKPTFIKNANFVINHAKGDSLLFRVNIYDYQKEQIGENILKENVLIATKQRKGTITVDLTPLNLILENDVLLTLEWIKDDNGQGNTGITFDTKKSRKAKGVYVKNTSVGDFTFMQYVNSKLKPCFYLMGVELNE